MVPHVVVLNCGCLIETYFPLCIYVDLNHICFSNFQMLGFFQHSKLALHYQSLLFWLV